MKNQQDMEKKMGTMQEGMLKMHEQMHKIMDAKNPQDRERLLQEHTKMMHQHMLSMKDSGVMGSDTKSTAGAGTGKENKITEKQH